MAMKEELEALLNGIALARSEALKNHPLANRISHVWPEVVEEMIADPSYKVTGSPGKGHWAHTVWLAIFDRLITETAQEGFYLVYLVPSDGSRIFLSLNQGTEEIYSQVGGHRYRQVLEDTAIRDRGLLDGEEIYGLISGPLDLGATSRLTRGYESGNIFAIEYRHPLPPEEELEADLTRLLLLYAALVEGRGRVQEEADDSNPISPKDRTEAARYRWHKRAERSRSLAREAKRFHGTRCQVPACGKNLEEIYGPLADGYIEAHHLTPFASLEGRPTDLDPKSDFAVVCPDCHRMIHRKTEPYSLEELSEYILSA